MNDAKAGWRTNTSVGGRNSQYYARNQPIRFRELAKKTPGGYQVAEFGSGESARHQTDVIAEIDFQLLVVEGFQQSIFAKPESRP